MNPYIEQETPLTNKMTGNKTISFVQGDTYTYTINITNTELLPYIDKLIFSCNFFNIEKEFIKNQDGSYSITLDDTASYTPVNTTYDVILMTTNNIVVTQTGVPLIVKLRQNPVKKETVDGV